MKRFLARTSVSFRSIVPRSYSSSVRFNEQLNDLSHSSQSEAYYQSLGNAKLFNKRMRGNKKNKRSSHHQMDEIEECASSSELFCVFEQINKRNQGNFDKFLVSATMDKFVKFNDFEACSRFYEMVKSERESEKFAHLLMLSVCPQFVNKYVFGLNVFYAQILSKKHKFDSAEINKAFSDILRCSILNNQFVSGSFIIFQYVATSKRFETAMLNAVLQFYSHFNKMDALMHTFALYEAIGDVYSFTILVDYFEKVNDCENMLRFVDKFIQNVLIKPFAQKTGFRAKNDLYLGRDIVIKIPNSIMLPIANYYAKNAKIDEMMALIRCLLQNSDIFKKQNAKNEDDDLNEFALDKEAERDLFFEKLMKRIDARKSFKYSFNRNVDHIEDLSLSELIKSNNLQMSEYERTPFEVSFVFSTSRPDAKIYFAALKCIGNCTDMNATTKWKLIDLITAKMKKYKIDFANNIFFGLFINLCGDDLNKALSFYHKMVSIAQKRKRQSATGNRFVGHYDALFIADYNSLYQVDGHKNNIDEINLFEPTHRELFNLLKVAMKHHSDNVQQKQLFSLWWINELKRFQIKPSNHALKLITDECKIKVTVSNA